MASEYQQIENPRGRYSKWEEWPKEVRLACCDCDYVHDIQFKIKDGKLWVRLKVNAKATAAKRRKR